MCLNARWYLFSAVARTFWGVGLGNGISNFGHRHRKMLHLPKQADEDFQNEIHRSGRNMSY